MTGLVSTYLPGNLILTVTKRRKGSCFSIQDRFWELGGITGKRVNLPPWKLFKSSAKQPWCHQATSKQARARF